MTEGRLWLKTGSERLTLYNIQSHHEGHEEHEGDTKKSEGENWKEKTPGAGIRWAYLG